MKQLEAEIIAFSELGEMIDLPINIILQGCMDAWHFRLAPLLTPKFF